MHLKLWLVAVGSIHLNHFGMVLLIWFLKRYKQIFFYYVYFCEFKLQIIVYIPIPVLVPASGQAGEHKTLVVRV